MPPLKGEVARIARRRGQPQYAEYHLECTKANSYNPLLPPLGEVPRSGKGGGVGDFELLPFNEPHPLSQPVRAASSPIGEPSIPIIHKTQAGDKSLAWGLRLNLLKEIIENILKSLALGGDVPADGAVELAQELLLLVGQAGGGLYHHGEMVVAIEFFSTKVRTKLAHGE